VSLERTAERALERLAHTYAGRPVGRTAHTHTQDVNMMKCYVVHDDDMARRGVAWHGMARHGTAWHGTARDGMAWHGTARHGMT
jgi:hypothetical protein